MKECPYCHQIIKEKSARELKKEMASLLGLPGINSNSYYLTQGEMTAIIDRLKAMKAGK